MSSTETEEEDDDSSNLQPLSVEDDIVGHQKVDSTKADPLADFRISWQREIHRRKIDRSDESKSRSNSPATREDEKYLKAEQLFRQGILFEQDGKMPEAVRFYRLALQLVPDVERRLYNSRKPPSSRGSYGNEEGNSAEPTVKEGFSDDLSIEDLMNQFAQRIHSEHDKDLYCLPDKNQTAVHISCLPMEVLLYVLRYAISSEVDMRVLEQISMVCSGFFLLARDPGLWHLACLRTWGFRTGPLDLFPSWREMYLSRPRLNFNGVYISKISYVRHGETSYQDQFYRPYHLVVYYRIIRFFADGTMLMFTSSEDPSTCMSAVTLKKPKVSGVLVGAYSLVGREELSAVLKRRKNPQANSLGGYAYGRRRNPIISHEQDVTFCLGLKINTYKRKRNNQLTWLNYEITTKTRDPLNLNRGTAEVTSRFDMATDQSLTPFYFSRVRSFTAASDLPLE